MPRMKRKSRRGSLSHSSCIGTDPCLQKLYKEIRGLLNKITPSTFDDLCTEFLQLQVYKMKDRMSNIIDIIFDKAVEEPKFCPLYRYGDDEG